jgi:hypothetical protein
MRILNLALRFGLELCALAALAYGGWHTPWAVWTRILIALALPLIAAVIWGRWVAPRAGRLLPDPQRLIPEWVVFGGATAALLVTGHPLFGVLFAGVAALNRWALHAVKA